MRFWNLNFLEPSGPVMGLIYLFLMILEEHERELKNLAPEIHKNV